MKIGMILKRKHKTLKRLLFISDTRLAVTGNQVVPFRAAENRQSWLPVRCNGFETMAVKRSEFMPNLFDRNVFHEIISSVKN